MEITDIKTYYLRLPEVRDRTDSSQDALIVEVHTDEGIVGYGEVDSCPRVVQAIVDAPKSHTQVHGLKEILVGQNPLDIEVLWQRMYEGTLYYGRSGAVIHAMAGVDMALWDLKGKALGQPVYRLLGGSFRDGLRAYASHMFGFTPEETGQRAAEAVEAGFTAVKFGWEPFGRREVAFDIAMLSAIRTAIGEETEMMVDVGLVWDAQTTVQRCERFAPYRPYWIEEPMAPDNLRGYAAAAAKLSTRIAAGEQECTIAGFNRLMDEGHVDVVQVDVTRVGLTQAMVIAREAAKRGLPVCNHGFTTGLNVASSMHFLTAIPNALFLEYCVEPGDLTKKLVRHAPEVVDGTARLTDEPGLGVDLDWSIVERYLVR